MERVLYHGTCYDFMAPDLSKGCVGKDFGCGFYLADNQQQAEEFVKYRSHGTDNNDNQYVNTYLLDDSVFESADLCIKRFDNYSEEWVDFVYEHRNQKSKVPSDFDIVYGPVADGDGKGKMSGLFLRYEAGDITRQQLLEGLKNKRGITFQYYFGTEKAITYLKYYCTYKLLPPNAMGASFKQYHMKYLDMIDWKFDATTRVVHKTYETIKSDEVEKNWIQTTTFDNKAKLNRVKVKKNNKKRLKRHKWK